MMGNNKNILLVAIFHVFISNLIGNNPMLKFLVTLGSIYWYTNNIRQSLSFAIISTVLSYLMSHFNTKDFQQAETFDAPDTLGDPLGIKNNDDNIDLTGGTGALSEVRVLADTHQSVMFSEDDDPDKPDNIELNPIIPVLDIETTKEWEREKQSRQAIEILKTEPQLGTKPPQETPALEPEAFTSLFYY